VCRRCGLAEGRQQVVLSRGNPGARLMLIGEAPGAQEDASGLPFVGRAGQLLDQLLAGVHLDSNRELYICNVVKCRPTNNRKPTGAEMAACRPFLDRQIALLQPRVILALGSCAAKALLGGEGRVGSLRGQEHEHAGTPVVVSYHPAYLLRNTADKSKAWEDLCRLRALLTQDVKSAAAGSTG
jgi:DNA polymerase